MSDRLGARRVMYWTFTTILLASGVLMMPYGYIVLTNPDFHDHFFPDMLPDDFAVAGSGSTIVELLRRAEAELSRDGWTLLDDAVAFVRRISPEHTPRGHGCSTWRQVLHEARPIFDVKRDAADPKRPGRTWYRTRPPQAIEPIPDIEA